MRRRLLVLLALGAAVLGFAWEALRSRPPEAKAIERGVPLRPDETSRMEGGVLLRFTRGSETVLELNATSMAQLEGGAHFVRDVLELRAYMADGRHVSLSARSGTVRSTGPRREDVAVVLEGDVRVRDPDGIRLETDELAWNTSQRRLAGPGPARLYGPGLEGRVEAFEYRPDERIVETRGGMELHLGAGTPWRIDAARALYRLGPGELVLPGAFRARQPDRSIVAAGGIVRPARDGEPLRFSGTGPVLLSGPGPGLAWQVAGGQLDVTRRAPPAGDDAEVSATSIAARRNADGAVGALGAARWLVEVSRGTDGDTVSARAPDGFAARWREPDRPAWHARGRRLELSRGPAGAIERLEARGQVEIRDESGLQLLGDRLAWSRTVPDQVLLEGEGARAVRGQDLVEAPLLRFERARRRLIAEGGAITEIAATPEARDGLFAAGEPVRVRSTSVTIPLEDGPIVFEGPVQAWQFDTVLRARRMSWSDAARRLVAEGEVVGRFVVGRRSERVRTVRAQADRLSWNADTRVAGLEGDARFEDADTRLRAATIDVEMDETGEVAHLEAERDVIVERQDDIGRADRLVWTGGRTGVIELRGERALARLLPAGERREVRASVIRYHLAFRRYETEGGGGRSVITGREPDEPRKDDRDGPR
ncbi:MAG: hypothetical protein D6738_02965 [Acidobacteria bacterium]|nr:MAG: hypothetical protein D6738_02965 [Acidobacteriota bacterium]